MPLFSITKLVTGWTFKKPATRLYPFEIRKPYAATRGHVVIGIDKCTFCTLCEIKCPTDAIAMDKVKRVWTIDRLRCIQCSACVDACNKSCLSMDNQYSPPATAQGIESFQGPPKPAQPAAAPVACTPT